MLRSPLHDEVIDQASNKHKLIHLIGAPLDGKGNTRYKQVSQSRAEEAKRQNQIEDLKEVRSKLIDLYLSVKIRKNEEIDVYDSLQLEEERIQMKDTSISCIGLIGYIQTSIEILMKLKNDSD